MVPKRKVGTGPKKKYGRRQINAIWRQIEKNAFLSSTELKLRLPRTLANIDARTVRRILFYDLDRPARIAALKPDLTEQNKMDRLAWVKTNMRKPRKPNSHYATYLDYTKLIIKSESLSDEKRVKYKSGVQDWQLCCDDS